MFLVVQPVHVRQDTRAARARKSANMASANMVSAALTLGIRLTVPQMGASEKGAPGKSVALRRLKCDFEVTLK